MLLVLIFLFVVCKLIFFGVDITKKVSETRRRLQQAWYTFAAQRLLDLFFIVTVDTYKNQHFDYSFYLGPEYHNELNEGEKAATLVSNHISGFDILQILTQTRGKASFLASDHLENIPVVGYCILACGGLFARRGASPEIRQACVDQIGEFQKEFEKAGPLKNQLVIFPEGSTCNNKFVLSFKRGAFSSLTAVSPIILKYDCPKVDVCNAVVKDLILYILILCTFERIVCFREQLPVFKPNKYLFETHKDKGRTEWEIYAWAVRDVMAKASGLKKHDQLTAERLQYFEYLSGQANTYLTNKKDD